MRLPSQAASVPACIKVDVLDVVRNIASMDRLLRAGFDLHFMTHGHTFWMENGGLKTTISDDSSTSPLQSRCRSATSTVEFSNGKTAVGARVAPIAADDERLEGSSRVEWTSQREDVEHQTCRRPGCGSCAER